MGRAAHALANESFRPAAVIEALVAQLQPVPAIAA
jgi:hypothetical protein